MMALLLRKPGPLRPMLADAYPNLRALSWLIHDEDGAHGAQSPIELLQGEALPHQLAEVMGVPRQILLPLWIEGKQAAALEEPPAFHS